MATGHLPQRTSTTKIVFSAFVAYDAINETKYISCPPNSLSPQKYVQIAQRQRL